MLISRILDIVNRISEPQSHRTETSIEPSISQNSESNPLTHPLKSQSIPQSLRILNQTSVSNSQVQSPSPHLNLNRRVICANICSRPVQI
ncbi:hypothetical protein MtrunA17_Chr4g0023241 [Medicago truncatula]|uniref:Uncharacterized protein n=1 Tax=Medicago truncatula TaxID=3880 RepID=A0A396I5Z7_MEDTR|nr:hypothetical protein MtrunA17_Chr4g0023241 [Medicago truncatula]